MSKTVRVSDETHDELERRATVEHRTLSGVVEALLARTRPAEDLTRLGIAVPRREASDGSVSEDVQEITDIAFPVLRRRLAETGSVAEKNESAARAAETPCGRCRVPWKNHQEGSRKNRAGTTGCTTFEDPS